MRAVSRASRDTILYSHVANRLTVGFPTCSELTAASAVQGKRGHALAWGHGGRWGTEKSCCDFLKLMDAAELLQNIGEDLLAEETEAVAAKVGRAALAAAGS
jgi:hypothetical protein